MQLVSLITVFIEHSIVRKLESDKLVWLVWMCLPKRTDDNYKLRSRSHTCKLCFYSDMDQRKFMFRLAFKDIYLPLTDLLRYFYVVLSLRAKFCWAAFCQLLINEYCIVFVCLSAHIGLTPFIYSVLCLCFYRLWIVSFLWHLYIVFLRWLFFCLRHFELDFVYVTLHYNSKFTLPNFYQAAIRFFLRRKLLQRTREISARIRRRVGQLPQAVVTLPNRAVRARQVSLHRLDEPLGALRIPARRRTLRQHYTDLFKAHCYTDRSHLSVIGTYTHGKAQTPLGRFVVDVLYTSKFATNTQEIEPMKLEP